MGPAKNVFFTLVFTIYIASIIASAAIMLLIYLDNALHKPMYIFLFSLIVNGVIGSSAVWPRVMNILITDDNTAFCLGFLPVFLIILSYLKIISIILTMSADARRKTFATCSPHLIIFIITGETL
ncbi:olfactory receptor 8K1-like [Sardina pilchardus]|uniref:olfactory receptor 8K1-like n=1 Tax=Sardina pilchardus TaxID=27697 RepID=UPI002E161D9F